MVWSGLVICFAEGRGSREPLFIGERHVARAEGLLHNSPRIHTSRDKRYMYEGNAKGVPLA